ncbi:MAG: hypothetical protein JWO86_7897 [Myxococcaceae bacterium]|nr:hypothetical protein [Myxococcaceae bacterium]MEA2750217.1 hypothetical protein [Myxococcales bacterium]
MSSRPLLVSLASVAEAAVVFAVMAALLVACGAGGAGVPGAPGAPGATSTKEGSDGGAASSAAASADAAPPPKPFAGSAAEATQLIGAAVDKNAAAVQKCVAEYRTRKNLPHERVTISMGIDQEGRLLGATLPKGKTDTPLSECVQAALASAAFPRSHSGVISITKSYEDVVQ